MAGRSTVTNLLGFTHFTLDAMESNRQVDVIYTDFRKAFDRVSHRILIEKLRNLGIHSSLLDWIGSYLGGRKQYVKFLGHSSRSFAVKSGVPHGSHIGPLLFNIFINDIVSLLSSNCLLYADDLKIYRVIASHTDAILLQNDLSMISSRCVEHT